MSAEQRLPASEGWRGAVATAHPAATEAGVATLAAGGNAVDAAVAAAWALCVCEPSGSGLGGQTVALLRLASGQVVVIDGHSRAPAAASDRTVSRAQQHSGHRATTVPTTPATLAYAQSRFGSMSLAQAVARAVDLAEEGYEITPLQGRQLRWCREWLMATPAASQFLNGGRPYRPGELFRQPKLAACLRRIVAHGVDDFYRGDIAHAIALDMERHGGLIGLSDLATAAPAEKEAVSSAYRDRMVITTPPPSGGPQLLHGLEVLERSSPERWDDCREDWHESIALAVHATFANRERAHRASLALAGVGSERGGETTHLCTADARGNVVSLTQSIQSLFGAKVANPTYGFLYNNYLTTCSRRRVHAHRLAAGCSARSNAAPTLVLPLSEDEPMVALGAAGSRRIISSLLHVISGLVDLELPLQEALAQPRVHARLSGGAWIERPAATPRLITRLRERFGQVAIRPAHSYAMGAVQALEFSAETTRAAADPRRDGWATSW